MNVDDNSQAVMESLGIARFAKSFRIARLLRLLRVFRILRLMKLPKYFVQVEERIQNEYAIVLIGIVKLTLMILTLNHVIACIWYGVGELELDNTRSTWIRNCQFTEGETGYRYATSLHWSLTQFTPAGMEVVPANLAERIMAIIVLVFALVTFSSFVSSITNAMTRLRNMNSEYAKQLLMFQRFLRQNKISTPLAVRMRRHLEYRLLRQKNMLEEKDIEVLKLLSEPLMMELHVEVYRPCFVIHPFFQRYNEYGIVMRKLCHTAITEISLSLHDVLFSYGETCEQMYFVKAGALLYTLEHNWEEVVIQAARIERSAGSSCMGVQLEEEKGTADHCVAEACLWTPWVHCGTSAVKGKAILICLNSSKFREVVRSVRWVKMETTAYARAFVQYLNTLTLLNDLMHTHVLRTFAFNADMNISNISNPERSPLPETPKSKPVVQDCQVTNKTHIEMSEHESDKVQTREESKRHIML